MKLYFAPGACSLADRIALREARIPATFEKVDLKSKTTETGADFLTINPKGYVPALLLPNGETVTENVAILFWIASQTPELMPAGALGQIRLLEALSYISSELHKSFKPFFMGHATEPEKANAAGAIHKRLDLLSAKLKDAYVLGPTFTAADAYLFVMLKWAKKFGVTMPDEVGEYFKRMLARESVRISLAEEGLVSA